MTEKTYNKSEAHIRVYDRNGFVAAFNIHMDAVELAEEIFAEYVAVE